jgi:cephalosporin hydroxylase
MSLPPGVTADLTTGALREYWLARASQHTQDSYAGVPLSKFPEDLRTYEHLLWQDTADTVVEIGTQAGGSALWFRDRLLANQRYGRIARDPRVISVDVSQESAREELDRADRDWARTISLVEGDVRDRATVEAVARLVAPGSRCFVIEDSAHEYDTTLAALNAFAQFVPPGGFLIVEDGCVDVEALRLDPEWPRGVLPALHEWLKSPPGREFRSRRDLELYGVSCHPEGFLQRAHAAAEVP